jgi:hypothetical protein
MEEGKGDRRAIDRAIFRHQTGERGSGGPATRVCIANVLCATPVVDFAPPTSPSLRDLTVNMVAILILRLRHPHACVRSAHCELSSRWSALDHGQSKR